MWTVSYEGLHVLLMPHGDNLFYLLLRNEVALIVDPPVARPVLRLLREKEVRLTRILITHHDADHIGGVCELTQAPDAEVETPTGTDRSFWWEGLEVKELDTPGHRRPHAAYWMPTPAPGLLFSGDCLFAAGCGRLNGLPPELMFASLRKLAALPDETHVYCGHDYLESNLAFAQVVEPENLAIARRIEEARAAKQAGRAALPSSIAIEKATNPFLRAMTLEEFAARRARKDRF